MEKYEVVKDLGAGSFGVTRLCRHKQTKEFVAVKFIERGPKIDENVEREIINHRSLRHPNIVRFKEVILTQTHLALVMEYASGGELFERVCKWGRFSEDEARHYFQQLISGVNYIHSMQICHRDLKLDNILLDGRKSQRLKICDFGYSKQIGRHRDLMLDNTLLDGSPAPQFKICDNGFSKLHSKPNTNVGSATYAAPEVVSHGQYDGKMYGHVELLSMLCWSLHILSKTANDTKNLQKTIKRRMSGRYKIPDYVHISQDCRHLLSCVFVRNPSKRISVKEIMSHPWFLKNLQRQLTEPAQAIYYKRDNQTFSHQSVEEIMKIVGEARKQLPSSSTTIMGYQSKTEEDDEIELEEEDEDEEDDEMELDEEEEDEEDEYV
ncbi:unnamed protein product [Citrullus colocynthis]|uniref:Protein kinase domain-containing protein n=1 Tax=Citrullus colocynthis TaxID=252529 RepID=A0ABP0YG55_9ROSI